MFHWSSILQQLRSDFLSQNSLYPFFYPCLEWLSNLQTLHISLPESISYLSSKSFLSRFVVFQSLSHVQLFVTPWTAAHQASLFFIISQSLLKLMSIASVMSSNHLILRHPLLFPPPNLSQHQGLFKWSVLRIRWPKYWSFSFSISFSNEYSGLISFTMDWLDLLAVQGTLKSLLQHHSSKASILLHSAFFILQFSHWHMTTGKP